jgi:endonuclease-3 related protein
MKYYKFKIKSVEIVLIGDENGLSELYIHNNTKELPNLTQYELSNELFIDCEKQLIEYFKGERTEFDLKLNPHGTEFQKKVWQALSNIPYGTLCTYKQVAEKIGSPKASRAVGLANNKNPLPIIVPCHRVIGSNKKLVGYAFGLDVKKDLINLETITNSFHKLAQHYKDISRATYDEIVSWWPAKDVFEMMIGSILTQNTNWKNVEKALLNFDNNLTPEYIESIDNNKLAEIIKPSGYHNQKAKKIKNLCAWFKTYNYNISEAKNQDSHKLRSELLNINGVGEETADSLMVYALRKTSFVIDAYTRRIFERVGLEVPKNYDEFRNLMEKHVPNNIETFDYYHGLLVIHAKEFCKKKPICEGCPLYFTCKKFGI